jgi:predicted dehydrogenase
MPDTFPAAADTRLEIVGSRGSLFLDGDAREMRLFTPQQCERIAFGGPKTADEVNGRLAGAFVESLGEFLRAAASGDLAAPTSAARTLQVVDVQAAILESAGTGRVIELAPEAHPEAPPEGRTRPGGETLRGERA